MNMLGAIAPTSVPIDPLQPANPVQQQAQIAVAAKVLDAQRAAGEQVMQLLDPNVGKHLDQRA
ncbi:MAG: putative motility protein [Dehalococcoidia bacterium]|nr:putative motility protein [Dehalococcoidia bacterium]